MGGLLPSLPAINTSGPVTDTPIGSQTWGLDLVHGRTTAMIDGEAAITQAIGVMLNMARYRWGIYSPNFGSELSSVLGKSRIFVMAQVPHLVEEALLIDSRITGVSNYRFSGSGDTLLVTFDVATIYGTIAQQSVPVGVTQ